MSVPTGIISHTRQVCSLYKRSVRNLEAWYDRRHIFRYRAVLLRDRFDKNKNITDMAEATRILEAGEKELFETQHFQPKKFAGSPGGCAFEREVIPPDWVLDYWHPLEKAQYPEYFARREERKKQYLAMWEKQYGKPSKEDLGHH
ncbi:NADH dehydrogenase [ubiquinone] 1 beta subcomplex subunit 9 [Eupeodes corollae]|uniref:NADH dehydrogenase [ubiquinone] 1 beta subcomplex subunit 9 n=1 Tax=Eupeodes corollae TaxID=290404 RepID=UPI0024939260|nr:NADH dehydrogenase [ubiquinone] 1 beta subcomplex subunit 9 [Eupeodes corollae]